MKLYVISGTSGSGKSIALHALEDVGVYCLDNLPVELLSPFANHLDGSARRHYQEAAIGIDARNLASDFERFPQILEELRGLGFDCRTIFLDAHDDTLIKRFSETRRRHPLTRDHVALADAIRMERALLEPISSHSDIRLDTTRTNVHQLRDLVLERIRHSPTKGMSILFESFGYKHGVPVDADFVFDVRCLPNPHWEPHLRGLTGRDAEVIRFLEKESSVEQMYETLRNFLETWVPKFQSDNRSYLTVALGCTGGQHRSVYFAERLAAHFRAQHDNVLTRHRELS